MHQENLVDQNTHFAFGMNWLDYAETINDQRLAQACVDLQRLSGHDSFAGKSFLDIGCGSGIHSVAALKLGAARVVAVDIDPDSVAASKRTLSRLMPAAEYNVRECSVFDVTPDRFGFFDIVYSWGVLHHTGNMRAAIETAVRLVAPGGELYIALYRKTRLCVAWRSIKRRYSRASPSMQAKVRAFYISMHKLAMRMEGRDFAAFVNEYGDRGMDYYHDVHDWLGGYPYESISPDDCRALLQSLGLELQRDFGTHDGRIGLGVFGSGCAEYAFRRPLPSEMSPT